MRTFTLAQMLVFVVASAAFFAVFLSRRESTWGDGLGWGWADTVLVSSWVSLSIVYGIWRLKTALATHIFVFGFPLLLMAFMVAYDGEFGSTPVDSMMAAGYLGCFFATATSFPIACLTIAMRGLFRLGGLPPASCDR